MLTFYTTASLGILENKEWNGTDQNGTGTVLFVFLNLLRCVQCKQLKSCWDGQLVLINQTVIYLDVLTDSLVCRRLF